ncbi:MAG: hypothetical protein R3C61_05875 [Bacteroidia bacterium]
MKRIFASLFPRPGIVEITYINHRNFLISLRHNTPKHLSDTSSIPRNLVFFRQNILVTAHLPCKLSHSTMSWLPLAHDL